MKPSPADLEVSYDITGSGSWDGKITTSEQLDYLVKLNAVNGIGDVTLFAHLDPAMKGPGYYPMVGVTDLCSKVISADPTVEVRLSCPGVQEAAIWVIPNATAPAGTTLRTGVEILGVNEAGEPRRVRGGPVTFHGAPTSDEASTGFTPFMKYVEFDVAE